MLSNHFNHGFLKAGGILGCARGPLTYFLSQNDLACVLSIMTACYLSDLCVIGEENSNTISSVYSLLYYVEQCSPFVCKGTGNVKCFDSSRIMSIMTSSLVV